MKNLIKYLNEDKFLTGIGTSCVAIRFIAAQFKNIHMKTSSLSPAIIKAALTIIINRINDRNTTYDERYAALKRSPFIISYTDDSICHKKGVRVFQVEPKNSSALHNKTDNYLCMCTLENRCRMRILEKN